MSSRTLFLISTLSASLAAQAPAQADVDVDLLMELLNTPTTVASKKAMTTRESPGIVTLIRREEILASGARDLQDLLRLVPGFSFATDVQGVTSLGIRGNWAHEGKVLLLIDGQEMNELRYATLQFGNHFPVDQIRQVEIIRGPGSAIYGGFAELAVINVITRDGGDLKGVSGRVNYGMTSDSYAQRAYQIAFGQEWDGIKFSAAYFGGRGNRSEDEYTDSNGTVSLKDLSRLRPSLLNLGLEAKGFSLRIIRDQYQITDFTDFRDPSGTTIGFHGTYVDAKYQFKASEHFTLTPRLTYKEQAPWSYQDVRGTEERKVKRSTIGLQASWDPSAALDLVFGFESTGDKGTAPLERAWANGTTEVSYTNRAFYAQALWSNPVLNVTLGGRFDKNSQFGSSFVPRLAVTKAWAKTNFKLLISKAFRAPVIENIELNPAIKPEKTTAIELEYGAQLPGGIYVSFNVFDISIKEPIVYQYIVGGGEAGEDLETYANYAKTGSRGVEADIQMRGGWGFFHGTFSYSQANDNQVPDYAVAGRDKSTLGLPSTKVTLLAGVKLGNGLTLNPSVIFTGARYGYAYEDESPRKFDPDTLVNLFLDWKVQDWTLSLGLMNATDRKVPFIQAYTGGGSPYPGARREAVVRVGYRL